jgi:hypothetical protein
MDNKIKQLLIEALDIQNACNLVALSKRFAQVMIELSKLNSDTDQLNKHMVVTLWLDKFNSLNGIQFDDSPVNKAYSTAFDVQKNTLNNN